MKENVGKSFRPGPIHDKTKRETAPSNNIVCLILINEGSKFSILGWNDKTGGSTSIQIEHWIACLKYSTSFWRDSRFELSVRWGQLFSSMLTYSNGECTVREFIYCVVLCGFALRYLFYIAIACLFS